MTLKEISLLAEAAGVLNQRASPLSRDVDSVFTGVDLGTATMVVYVVDAAGKPIAGRMQAAQVVRDGLVVDYLGAVDLLGAMKEDLEAQLGLTLRHAAGGYPPGVPEAEVRAIGHVIESVGLQCDSLVDEPTAANHVLQIENGAIVDVGGGTTGVSILKDGEVVHTADEATGGTHFNLVIAGALDISVEDAERLKMDRDEQDQLMGLVRPVIEKVATIVGRQLEFHPVDEIFLVGGACKFHQFDQVMEETLQIPTYRSPHPQLVTPLGIARSRLSLQNPQFNKIVLETTHG